MLRFARDGDTVVVHSMDRLARNLDDLRALVQGLTRKGVRVKFAKEGLVFTGEDSPMANLMLSVMGAFAEFERSLIRERQREGIALAKQRGAYKGRKKTLTPERASEMVQRAGSGVPKSVLARDYGISRETVYQYLATHLVAGDAALMAWHDDNELNRDAALDIANALDRAKQFYKTEVDGGHVFHCSLSLAAEEGQLSDEQWGAIANDFMKDMDFTEDGGKAPARWVAVRHGLSKNGNDHIHIVASMVRDDGTKWNSWKSKYKSQQIARALEKKYGLTELDAVRAERGYTPAEQAKATRQGLPEVERHSLARKVRTCAAASTDEAEFVRRARQEGLLVRPRYAAGRTDVVTGYSVAERPRKGERAVWFGGNSLGRDLALPKLRCEWESTPKSATAAVAEWNAVARNRRPVAPGRETLQPSAELWGKYANDINGLREKLATTPHNDHVAWAQAARETAAAFGAWSKRIEPTPGPLADAARELSKSAQLRRYPKRSAAALPSARGATMILLAATSKSERAAYALMFRQLTQTAWAIYDMHKATDDLRRVRGLAAAVTAASKVVEASATTQTIKAQPITMEALREQHPGASEEALRARLIAERTRGGSPIPTTLTRAEKTLQQTGTTGPQEPHRDHHPNPGIER